MILVTGGAGYIGSHCALELIKKGYKIIIIDNLTTGHIETINKLKEYGDLLFYETNILDTEELNKIFSKNNIETVFHFAAFSEVGESMKTPEKYFKNNVEGTKSLINAMIKNNIKKIIFSSTAAIYGEPQYVPIDENHPKKPINPYGQTKLEIEQILDQYDNKYGLKSIRLRYFNVAGADKEGKIGEWHNPETHLIPNILKSTFETEKVFQLFGDNYDTKDGTCVRDYINIHDLINAHILAHEYLNKNNQSNFFNLGTKEGNTVKEVFTNCEEITRKRIPILIKERRIGDPAKLIADNKKAKEILNWEPKHTLKDSILSAYNWEKSLNNELILKEK